MTNVLFLLRWLHFLAGITWIGMLYFFNLVNVKFMKELDAATKGKVVPNLMPKALWWFRWGAFWTVVAGLALHMSTVTSESHGLPAFFWVWLVVVVATFVVGTWLFTAFKKDGRATFAAYLLLLVVMSVVLWKVHSSANTSWKVLSIALGGGMGIIMFMNVWMIIWPLQKKIIAATRAQAESGAAPPAEMPAWARRAFLASRANAWMSVAMLFFMGAASHFPIGIGK
ncbi:MAG TPA: urate hydroxylase PuuD [Thermoanaerobaculia bacterium]|nr:urate hydroxylase PuuD [Thermoanaerobaculia bacterium]